MTKTAIITGITGFVGGFLAEKVLQSGGRVLGFSPHGDWLPTSPIEIRPHVQLSAWDLSEIGTRSHVDELVCREIEQFQPEIVYHLAAMSVPTDCGASEPNDMAIAVNIEGTRRVVEATLAAAPHARLVFISSSHVYAPVSTVAPQVTESAPVGPVQAYGKTKLAAEQIVLDAVAKQGLDAVIARAFQHTGPRQTGCMMLPEWMQQIVDPEQRPIQIHTRDAQIDLLDVRDVVRAYELLAERGKFGMIYNVGSGQMQQTGVLLDRLLEMADIKSEIIQARPGVKQDPVADISRLQQDVGWEPQIPMEQTLSDTLAWWREYIEHNCI